MIVVAMIGFVVAGCGSAVEGNGTETNTATPAAGATNAPEANTPESGEAK